MININWKATSQHNMQVEPRRLVAMCPEILEHLPEDFGYDTTTEEEFVEAFHSALEDRPTGYRIADRFVEESTDSSWTDTDVEADDIEADVRTDEPASTG